MNTALLNEKVGSLTAHIESWLLENPGIIGSDEQLVVDISATRRPSMVKVTTGGSNTDASNISNEVLDQDVDVLKTFFGRIYGCKNEKMFSTKNIKTIRELVTYKASDLLRVYNYGNRSLNELVAALKELDSRLELGMILPPSPSS